MDCNKASKLMMKFMDNSLTDEENLLLEKHLEECVECKKDFSLYTEILEDFSTEILDIEVPENLEEMVMEKIEEIEPRYIDLKNRTNIFYYITAGLVSLLFSIGILVNMNKEIIIENFKQDSLFYKILDFYEYIEMLSNSFVLFLNEIISTIISNLPTFMEYLRISSFICILILILAQYRVYKNNIEAQFGGNANE